MHDAIPAATMVIFRQIDAEPPQLLMVERARNMAFAPGALVFPGGRLDADDQALAKRMADAPSDAAARIAAIRETLEETGLGIGLVPAPSVKTLELFRSRMAAGIAFSALLMSSGHRLDLSVLTPFARWRPSHLPIRIFDTYFYLAEMPLNAPPPVVDETENVRLLWITARDALNAAEAGRVRVIFPTRRNLERLALFDSLSAARADAASYPIRPITPWIEERNGTRHLCIDDDLGYPVTSEPADDAVRG